ncbi:MAG: XRE family transcriptional regulator [Bdellovibrionales bacterium]|nr:XRE family transcriptional regulator [Bdellovibrionales bacterium]
MNQNFFEAKNTKELCKLLGISEKEAVKIEIRRNLVVAIKKVIEKQKWTHEVAAEEADVGRTVITAIVNGNLQKISTDRLIDIAQNLGLTVKLKVA